MIDKKEYFRKYHLQHKEEISEYNREYREKHREEIKKHKQEYYLQHKKEVKAYSREYEKKHSEERQKYMEKHKEKMKAYRREYRKKHREEINTYGRKYRHRKGINKKYQSGISYTPEYWQIHSLKRRIDFKNAGELTFQTLQQVYDENLITNGGVLKCIYCSKELTKKEATLEHKQPLSRGGTNDKENLAIDCKGCNSGKRDKTEKEFENYLNKKGEKWRII